MIREIGGFFQGTPPFDLACITTHWGNLFRFTNSPAPGPVRNAARDRSGGMPILDVGEVQRSPGLERQVQRWRILAAVTNIQRDVT